MATYIPPRSRPPSPYWLVQYRAENGRLTMRSTKHTDEKKARAFGDKLEAAAKLARHGELTQAAATRILGEMMKASGETLKIPSAEQYFTDWLAEYKGATAKRYSPIVTNFLKSLPEKRRLASLQAIAPSDIRNFHKAEIAEGKAETTAALSVRILRVAFARAVNDKLLPDDPTTPINLVRDGGTSEERDPFMDDELRALLKAAKGTDWEGGILLGTHTGIRLADMAARLEGDIDRKAHTMRFTPQKTSKKKPKPITVALHPEIMAWLKKNPRPSSESPLFPKLHGHKVGSGGGLSNQFTAIMKKAGIIQRLGPEKKGKGRQFRAKSFHSLRHTMVSRLATGNVSADVRKAMAGHTTDASHDRYTHLDVQAQHAAIASVPAIRD